MSYEEGLKWIFNHQHPDILNKDEYIILSHPWHDGDGLATRINRLMRRCIPYILTGKVVILSGGFRGYGCTDPNDSKGFTKFFQPFCRFNKNLEEISDEFTPYKDWESNYRNVPDYLSSKEQNWWLSVLITYFMRPSDLLKEYIDLKTNYLNLPDCYIGLHIRRGDHPRGLKYTSEDYIKIIDEKILTLWRNVYGDKPAVVYLATDDKEIAHSLSDKYSGCSILTDKRGIYSHNISHLGQSASNTLIRNSNQEWTIVATLEVLSDIHLLSKSSYICGLMVSQVTLLSVLIGKVNSNLIYPPFAVDYNEHKTIEPDGGFVVKFTPL